MPRRPDAGVAARPVPVGGRAAEDPRCTPADPKLAAATFARLVRDLPGSAAAWSGQADALVRRALATPRGPAVGRPASLRARARPLPPRRPAQPRAGGRHGRGPCARRPRALQGGGGPRADGGRPACRGAPLPLAQLMVYLEGAHRWAAVARAADALERQRPRAPAAFYPAVPAGRATSRSSPRTAPVSLGARAAPAERRAAAAAISGETSTVSVGDLTFLPVFRPERRDRERSLVPGVLAGSRPPAGGAARAGAGAHRPRRTATVRRAGAGPRGLRRGRDLDGPRADRPPRGRLAGVPRETQIPRRTSARTCGAGRATTVSAERAARQWVERPRRRSWPRLRLGEIEFLRHRYDDAAGDFAAAGPPRPRARRRRRRGRGAARPRRRARPRRAPRGGRGGAARRRRRSARAVRRADPGAVGYYAREQLGDAAREAGALPAAAEAYAAAARAGAGADATGAAPIHPEALENNAAIVDAALGRTRRPPWPPPGARCASTRRTPPS